MKNSIVRKRIPHAAPFRGSSKRALPLLESGDTLDSDEFLRRYEAMPELKKAELIDGIVYVMSSPVSTEKHGDPDNTIQGCFYNYSLATWGVRAASNSTILLGPKNIPQPDISLRYLPERRGKPQFDKKGYQIHPPELIVEIAGSSASIDAHKKRDIYCAAGVPEYILWQTYDFEINGWYLENGVYRTFPVGDDGILRSRKFPGLWLDLKALLSDDLKLLQQTLDRGLKSPEHAAFLKKKRHNLPEK